MENKQNRGLKRNTIDKFYTIPTIALNCINHIKSNLNIDFKQDLIIEPSAGNGSFIHGIKTLSEHTVFYDIEPDNKDIIKQDFLELNLSEIYKEFKKIHFIGNPPFGKQASTAIKFIKKCCEYGHSISFILPKSFKKESMQKHFDRNFHLIYETDLNENSFLMNSQICDVPCVFQIWEKKISKRLVQTKIIPTQYKFVKITESPDISFRRIGVYAGKISTETKDKSTQSHYFIKFTNNKPLEENLKLLESIQFEFNNTVGPKSISKSELIREFNKFI